MSERTAGRPVGEVRAELDRELRVRDAYETGELRLIGRTVRCTLRSRPRSPL
ncbi:MAG TPA: hypothetical protein VHX59_16240 [Mycobacteriales bacterium]|nr:hypothetical protein [Mycobacteriales bacterium]